MDETPDTNGRSASGRFTIGNTIARGNPNASAVAKFRSALLANINAADFSDVIAALVTAAKSGDMNAVKILLDRTIGKVADLHDAPAAPIIIFTPESIDERRARLKRMIEDLTPTQRREITLSYATRFEKD